MLKRDIDILEDLILCGVGSGEVDGAWVRMKKFIVEAQNKSTNKPITPCLTCKHFVPIK